MKWDELKEPFAREVFRRGLIRFADAIPADRSTVYRLMRGHTTQPSRAVQAGIERLVEEGSNSEQQ